ncbi:hypothetical protein BC938DRAFT_472182, partial [Jimgerdemannia flammicorona]
FLNLMPKLRANLLIMVPWDLFACSMVCRRWYNEARPLLDSSIQPGMFQTLRYTECQLTNGLKRHIELLAGSRRIGLDYIDLIKQVTIDLLSTSSDFQVNILKALFVLRPPNLTHLKISDSCRYYDRTFSIVNQPQNFWPPIRRLSLNNFRIPNLHQEGMNSLISVFSTQLESLSLANCTIPHTTHEILSRCTRLRYVKLSGVEDTGEGIASVLSSWPELRHFHYEHARILRLKRIVRALNAECLHLESFVAINTMASHDTPTLLKIVTSLSRFPELRRVSLFHIGMDYDEDLVPHGLRLKYTDWKGDVRRRIHPAPRSDDGAWPELRKLSLRDCGEDFAESLLGWAVQTSPKLEEISVPFQLMERNALNVAEVCRRKTTYRNADSLRRKKHLFIMNTRFGINNKKDAWI